MNFCVKIKLTQSMVASSKTISPHCFPVKIAFCSFSHSKNDTIVMVQNQKCNNGPESTCRLHCDLRLEFMESASFFFHSPFPFYFCVFTLTFRSEHFPKSAYHIQTFYM